MSVSMIENDIIDTTRCLFDIIYQKYQKQTHGKLKGYLVPDEIRCVIPRRERKQFSALGTGLSEACLGSVKCGGTIQPTHSLTAMLVAYTVKNNLLENFRNYTFKKFKIDLETYPKYRYDKNKLMRYRKTGDDITFMKVDIEW